MLKCNVKCCASPTCFRDYENRSKTKQANEYCKSEMSVIARITNNILKRPVYETETTFGELWKDDRCVIVFFRRWGCPFCRLAAREISAIQPLLAEHNVKLIGVGVEQFGVAEFINGNFFKGDVFVDEGPPQKGTYATLDFKTMSFREMFQATLSVAAHCITVYGSIW